MREGIGAIVALIGMGLFVVSIITLIRPIRRIKLGTRKRAGIALAVSIGLFILGGTIMPPPTPEQIAAREAVEAQRTVDREKADQERTAKRSADQKADADREAAALEQQKPAMTAAAKSLWDQVTVEVSSCDQSAKIFSDYMGRRGASIYEAYPLAQQAERICGQSATNVGRIGVPDTIPSTKRDAFKEAIETCRNAYYAKSSAFDQMSTVLNGDMRPSAVSDARQAAERAEAGTMLCGLGFLKAVNDAGLSLEEVMGEGFTDQ
ncbi:MAG: hypothetical protein ACI9YM_000189 [Brevundimonas sp.]|jgi:hypothetical protein|uniref:hypothetical protein n=1 Tax=Brevundimonas sp. TaxID=1871086 RepID=UPI0039E6B28D